MQNQSPLLRVRCHQRFSHLSLRLIRIQICRLHLLPEIPPVCFFLPSYFLFLLLLSSTTKKCLSLPAFSLYSRGFISALTVLSILLFLPYQSFESFCFCRISPFRELGQLVGKSARLVIKRLRVRIPAGAAGEFSSPESTLCADFYSVSVPSPCYAVACKRSQSYCQKCRWQVTPKHTYTLHPMKSEWADCVAVQAQCGNLFRNKLIRNLPGNTWPQSSHLAEPLWPDPGLKSGISVRELIPTLKKKKSGKFIVEHSPKSLARVEETIHVSSASAFTSMLGRFTEMVAHPL